MTKFSDLARLPGDHRAALLTRFRSGVAGSQVGLRPAPRGGPLPLSSAQAQLWFLDRLAPGRSTYNVPAGYRLRGPLDVAALRAALADVAARHEVLRTGLYEHDGAGMQRIHECVDVDLPVLDIDGPGPGERLAAARRDAEELARTPFDLAVAPLWRARLYRLGTDDHFLVLVFHHVVSDGWSIGVFADDLGAFYAARTGRAAAMPGPLTIQYADYACWQRGWLESSAAEQLAQYWRDQLANVSAVDFPADRPRSASLTYEGSSLRRRLDPAIVCEVHAAAAAAGVTPYVMYLAAFLILLHRYTGQDDLTVGSPNANRGHAETERLIGFFVNMLVLRTSMAGDPSVRALLTRVHDVVREAMAHGELPFEQVVDAVRPVRDPSRSPLFQIGFGLQNAGAPLELPGLRITQEPIDLSTSRFDLSWNLTERPNGLEVQVEFSTNLFNQATMQGLAGQYEQLLRGVLSDADRPISRIRLLTAAERAELVHRWDGPTLPVPPVSLAELFQRQVRRNPAATAVVVGGAEFSYDAVNRRANQLARLLTAHGVTPGSRVALCLPRDLNLIIAMLAVLKAGAAYVPVDATHPPTR
ncbi:MAG TPA: condensation domain-containing protein, partial [Trebonia sp.]